MMSMAKETCSDASSSEAQIVDDVIFQVEEDEDDSCSICLHPFSAIDPSTVTGCNHEYHFHCILEWSQRSEECPICWQFLMLKDPVSQELLAAAGTERAARSSANVQQMHEVHELPNEAAYINDSDYEERMMQHLAARYYQRKQRQSPQSSSSVPSADMSNMQQTINLRGECATIGGRHPVTSAEFSASSEFPSVTIGESSSVNIGDCLLKPSSPVNSSRRSSSSELLAFSNSIRSKISAASIRCKESISKGTNGFKGKLLARNTTVKELSREVQREMNAGIAGVAKMIERLDLSSKRNGASSVVSSCKVETSNLATNGNCVQENKFVQAPSQNIEPSTEMLSSDRSSLASKAISNQQEVSFAKVRE